MSLHFSHLVVRTHLLGELLEGIFLPYEKETPDPPFFFEMWLYEGVMYGAVAASLT